MHLGQTSMPGWEPTQVAYKVLFRPQNYQGIPSTNLVAEEKLPLSLSTFEDT